MRKFFFATAVFLLSSSWGLAQNSPSPEQTPDKSQIAELEKHGKAVEGCLAGSANTFTLTNAKGRPYKLTGDTSGLKANVGHTVRLYGNAASSGYDPDSIYGTQATFGVKRVESLSDTCK
jgi:hypothetical protein